jgi:hypothetical protein
MEEGSVKAAVLAVTILFLIAHPADADPQRGDQLLWKCAGKPSDSDVQVQMDKLLCAYYLQGFLDSYGISHEPDSKERTICVPPSGISTDQTIRIVVKWLESHPEILHESARMNVFLALRTAFPCGNS